MREMNQRDFLRTGSADGAAASDAAAHAGILSDPSTAVAARSGQLSNAQRLLTLVRGLSGRERGRESGRSDVIRLDRTVAHRPYPVAR